MKMGDGKNEGGEKKNKNEHVRVTLISFDFSLLAQANLFSL
jgi:hypothetical protein